MHFYQVDPSLDNYWRSIILFGKNVASYKFALAKAMYGFHARSNDLVSMEQLAESFSMHLCEHLKHSPKQITSKSSRFLSACKQYNDGLLDKDALITQTVKLGFSNVIDAFHIVNQGEIEQRFFLDERKQSGGIRITENFFKLANSQQFENFENETEARWRLVEQAWAMGVSSKLIHVEYDQDLQQLFTGREDRRVTITSCRDSLNGYQKGKCFYCYDKISIVSGSDKLCDVDHFIPWIAKDSVPNINGVWNLVLACKDCNRGKDGKFAKVPKVKLLERLYKRNEYFITSHLPLRETMIQQTGINSQQKQSFLQSNYTMAKLNLLHEWEPREIKGSETF